MFQKALVSVIVYAVFNLAALNASSDPVEERLLAQLNKSINEFPPDGQDKNFERIKKEYMDYLSKTHKNRTVNENREYLKNLKRALTDERYKHVTINERCMNMTAAMQCKNRQYQASENISLKKKMFNKRHEMRRRRSSCNISKNINTCILKNVFTNCDNTTIEYFKQVMEDQKEACLKALSNNINNSDDTGGAEKGSKITLGSMIVILTTFFFL